MPPKSNVPRALSTVILLVFIASTTFAQQSPAPKDEKPSTPAAPRAERGPRNNRGPSVKSPEVQSDRKITFRILAPKAEAVRLNAGDLPGGGPQQPRNLTKGENGVWELTLGPVDPGTYRYLFDVDGVSVVDPRSNAVSESNGNTWSVVHVPGSDYADEKEAPHGAVAAVRTNDRIRTERALTESPFARGWLGSKGFCSRDGPAVNADRGDARRTGRPGTPWR